MKRKKPKSLSAQQINNLKECIRYHENIAFLEDWAKEFRSVYAIMEQTDPRGYGCVSYDWLTGKIKEAYEQGRADAMKELTQKSLEEIKRCTQCYMEFPECSCSDDGPSIYALVEKIEDAKEKDLKDGGE